MSAYVSAFENAAADPVAKSGLLPEDAKVLAARAVKRRVGVASLCSQDGERGWTRLLAFY